jgi:hypothetical protein
MENISNCRIALIAWSIKPPGLYLNMGEIYDPNMKQLNILYDFYNEIKYLYPFRCSVKQKNVLCYNIEDFRVFQTKYKLTKKIVLCGEKEGVITFKSPLLYDLSCMIPLFIAKEYVPYSISEKRDDDVGVRLFVVVLYKNPITRAKILNCCLEKYKKGDYMVVTGGKKGNNKDTIATLATRYLLKYIPNEFIIKNSDDSYPGYLLEGITISSFIINNIVKIYIASNADDIFRNMEFIKKFRKTDSNLINKHIRYISP